MQQDLLSITLEYCTPWNYTARAVSLTEEVLSEREIEYFIKDWKLVPASGGKFEVTINGELVWSKKQLGRHAESGEVKEAIQKFLKPLIPEGFKMPEKD